MRVLFLPSPVATHFTPMAPLGWALRAAGHDVLVAGRPNLAGAVHDAGFSQAVVGAPWDELAELRRAASGARWRPAAPAGRRPLADVAEAWRRRTTDVAGPLLDLARRWRPALIVADP